MTHMTEYIDKTEAMRRFKPFGREIPKDQVMSVIARVPTTESPKGKWNDIGGVIRWGCSLCHYAYDQKFNFCPNCGADMRGDDK